MNKWTNRKADAFASFFAAGIVVLACSGRASSAATEDTSSRPTKVVSYADLNLDNPAGASAFYRRIRAAADDVCSSYNSRDLKITAMHQHCVENAVSVSVSHVNKASVTAIHNRSEGHAS